MQVIMVGKKLSERKMSKLDENTILTFLTFKGPCIMMYSYNESQWDALFLKFIW